MEIGSNAACDSVGKPSAARPFQQLASCETLANSEKRESRRWQSHPALGESFPKKVQKVQ
jgi:hypothetical protein